MSDPTPDPERRQKLFGRLVVIGLGLLIALYLTPMFIRLFNGG